MPTRPPVTARRFSLLPVVVLASACASAPAVVPARGVPGFDTRDYPGGAVMAAWLESSPYRWVGYYLHAPCYTGTSWTGRRRELEEMGWGVAVIFVGEQDWGEARGEPALADSPGAAAPRCTTSNLTAERGTADAAAAEGAAAGEGFPRGTAIFLDVERVDALSSELVAYVRSWAEGLLEGGRYLPGLYAHESNAEPLYAVVAGAFARAGRTNAPRLWVASGRGFDLRKAPVESGVPWASVWQGAFDVRESWGGVTLRIDANVASSASPSR